MTLWAIWFFRNRLVFQQRQCNSLQVVRFFLNNVPSYKQPYAKSERIPRSRWLVLEWATHFPSYWSSEFGEPKFVGVEWSGSCPRPHLIQYLVNTSMARTVDTGNALRCLHQLIKWASSNEIISISRLQVTFKNTRHSKFLSNRSRQYYIIWHLHGSFGLQI